MIIGSQLAWHVSRASGLVAWALLAASVGWGLLLSTRVLGRHPTRPWLLELHRFLSGGAVLFVVVHLAGLLADTYVHFTIADLLVPMASPWRPGAVAWGVVALYLLAAVELTSLVMERLPRGVWRTVHFSSFALFVLATVHGLLAGTDRGNLVVQVLTFVGCGEIVALIALRLYYRRSQFRSASTV
jgi:predicted ferric reductase